MYRTAPFLSDRTGLFADMKVDQSVFPLVATTEVRYQYPRVVGGDLSSTPFMSALQSLLFWLIALDFGRIGGPKIPNKLQPNFRIGGPLGMPYGTFPRLWVGLFATITISRERSICLSLVHTTSNSYKLRRIVGGRLSSFYPWPPCNYSYFKPITLSFGENLRANRFSTSC